MHKPFLFLGPMPDHLWRSHIALLRAALSQLEPFCRGRREKWIRAKGTMLLIAPIAVLTSTSTHFTCVHLQDSRHKFILASTLLPPPNPLQEGAELRPATGSSSSQEMMLHSSALVERCGPTLLGLEPRTEHLAYTQGCFSIPACPSLTA